jgi:hypothetical protein
MSVLPPKATIERTCGDVRFVPDSDVELCSSLGPLYK